MGRIEAELQEVAAPGGHEAYDLITGAQWSGQANSGGTTMATRDDAAQAILDATKALAEYMAANPTVDRGACVLALAQAWEILRTRPAGRAGLA